MNYFNIDGNLLEGFIRSSDCQSCLRQFLNNYERINYIPKYMYDILVSPSFAKRPYGEHLYSSIIKKSISQIKEEENKLFFNLLNENISIFHKYNQNINELIVAIKMWNDKFYSRPIVLMSAENYNHIINSNTGLLDPVTQRSVSQMGLYATLCGAEIHVRKQNSKIYLIPEENFGSCYMMEKLSCTSHDMQSNIQMEIKETVGVDINHEFWVYLNEEDYNIQCIRVNHLEIFE